MATISENLQTIKTSMSAIKQAISDRGGDVSGDISTWAVSIENIEGGGSSSGGGAYSEVNHGTSDTTFTLTPNTFHVWDEVSSLTLTLGSERSGVANEYLFQFTSGATATTLVLPDTIKWVGGSAPSIQPNMIYQVSILKGLASVLEFSNINVITFTCDSITYVAESNMTWQQFTLSNYNVEGWEILGNEVTSWGGYVCYNGSRVKSYDIIIEKGSYYIEIGMGGGGYD